MQMEGQVNFFSPWITARVSHDKDITEISHTMDVNDDLFLKVKTNNHLKKNL